MWVTADVLSTRSFSTAWIPYANGLTRFATYALMVYLITQIRILLKREAALARNDQLTGLLNRRAFLEGGGTEVKRAERYARSVAVLFIDLDNFKQLNDSRGHKAGDAALKASGLALTGAVRSVDMVARLGGDEFAILMPEVSEQGISRAVDKVAARISEALAHFQPVSASIGVAWFAAPDRSLQDMIKTADEVMYEVKRKGKGKSHISFFSTPVHMGAIGHLRGQPGKFESQK